MNYLDIKKSFTEIGFLNPYYLDYLNPSNCEERNIEGKPKDSLVETLCDQNPYIFESPEKTAPLHKGLKPLRFVARTVYGVFLTSFVSPFGASYHGTRSLYHVSVWTFAACKGDEDWKKEQAVKTALHVRAFFTDLLASGTGFFSFSAGVLSFYMLTLPVRNLEDRMITVIFASMVTAIEGLIYGGFCPEKAIPNLVAYGDQRQGMHLSLALRNEFGIRHKKGRLLPHNHEDRVAAEISFRFFKKFTVFKNAEKLLTLIGKIELEFCEAVYEAKRSVNGYFSPEHLCSYPKNQVSTIKDDPRIDRALRDRVELTWKRVQAIHEMYSTCCEEAVNGGLFEQIAKALLSMEEGYTHKGKNFYLPPQRVQQYFDEIGKKRSKALHALFSSCPLPSRYPSAFASNSKATDYEKFKQSVQAAKWNIEKNHSPVLPEPRHYDKATVFL